MTPSQLRRSLARQEAATRQAVALAAPGLIRHLVVYAQVHGIEQHADTLICDYCALQGDATARPAVAAIPILADPHVRRRQAPEEA